MYERRPSTNRNSPNRGVGFTTPIKSEPESSDSSYSPNISRYGRSHKPKMQEDYVSTDKKVSAYLKLSPGNQMQYFSLQKEYKKKASPKVVPEGSPRRGRPPKSPLNNSERENKLKAVVKQEPQNPSCPVDGCEWMVGDLAWARVGGHPFWPCIIALDPIQGIFTKTIRKGRNMVSQRWVHVQFFGDNGRRSWLNVAAVMSYNGRDAFIQLGDTILAGMRKKEPKQTSAFVIKPAVVQVWEKAVQEAEDLVHSTREERAAFFTEHFPIIPLPQPIKEEEIEQPNSIAIPPSVKRGRKRKAEGTPLEEETKKKQIKLESEEEKSEPVSTLLTSTPRTIADRKKRHALLIQLARSSQSTPETPTPNVTLKSEPEVSPIPKQTPLKRPPLTETTELSVEKKKPKKKDTKKNETSSFRTFCMKNYNRVCDDHPNFTEKQVNKYLLNSWNTMYDNHKSRMMSVGSVKEKVKEEIKTVKPIEETEETEGSSEDIEEEILSSKSSSPAPSTVAAATQKSTATKRNNCKYLFSGAKSEKVCQICEKTGDTVRCRGPCQGYYHPDCITNPPAPQLATPLNKKGKKKGRPKKSVESSPNISSPSTPNSNIQPEEQVNNGTILLKEEDSKVSLEVKAKEKTEENRLFEKEENGENESLVVELIESEGKSSASAKVRKGSKDSESGEEGEGFRCKDCLEGRTQPCFVCYEYVQKKTGETKLYRCITAYCGKVYHEECLKSWPQSSWRSNGNGKSCDRGVITCPQHTCHTCASDNPGVIKARYSNDKLVRCIRCPTTYHYGNYCLPAGSEILTNTQIICPQHYQPSKKMIYHVNAAWCFICASGGSLICCDLCPTSFHADCLNISTPPDGSYVCEDCLTGRYPLYGEIVWVKLGTYRWWPAEILYPALIPDNILNLPHVRGEFAVRFFGSHDHYWVNRGRVFLYQDGDTAGKSNYKKSSVDNMFEKAVKEASEAQRKYLEEKATRDAETRPGMKPPNYVKLKTNRPVGNVRTMEMNISNLTPCECDPTSDTPCAPESDCLNRILMVECNPIVCPAGEKCCNQLFEKRQYPPLQPYQTQARGWGLKTLVALKKGDFVIEYVGEMIDEEEYKKRLTHMHENNEENFYFLTIDKDRMLDAGPKGNVARFMNHSCQPNCETQKWTVNGDTRVGLFAVCDIPANTELVFNYNLESIGSDKKPCMCGAPNCSGFIGVKATKNQDKEESKEKKTVKKKKIMAVSKAQDEACFVCGEGGEQLQACDGKNCTKGYHLQCLGKKQPPQGYWLCPWHQCNICNKGRVRRCKLCVNSFCQEHAEGNIREVSDNEFICSKHDQENLANNAELSTKIDPTITDPKSMEVDGDSSENSTVTPNTKLVVKVEPMNNNIIKSMNTPTRRSKRSMSYSGGKSCTDTVVNGTIDNVNKRTGRPSSVDEKLIVSYEKTGHSGNKSSNLEETENESNGHKNVKELLDRVIDSLPFKERKVLETISEDLQSESSESKILKRQEPEEKNNQSIEVVKLSEDNKRELGNQSLEILNAKNEVDRKNCGLENNNSAKNVLKSSETDPLDIDESSNNDSYLKDDLNSENKNINQYSVSEPKQNTETGILNINGDTINLAESENQVKIVDIDEIIAKGTINTNKTLADDKEAEFELSISKFDFLENSSKVDSIDEIRKNINPEKVTEISKGESTAELTKVTEDLNNENLSKKNETTIMDVNKNDKEGETASSQILNIDEHMDDFELSYSESSNDKVYKSVSNSESSIQMKLTDCISTEDERITKRLEEMSSKNDLTNCIEQSNTMEVV